MSIKSSTSAESSLSPDRKADDASHLHIDDLEILKLLGAGRTGKVFLARHRRTNQLLALKVIPKATLTPKDLSAVIREQRILKDLALASKDYPHFVRLVASCHDTGNFYLAMEYLAGGDLAIELGRCKTFDEERVRIYAAEIITALEDLHARGIVHRDIKPANLLFRPDGHIVIADFGHSLAFSAHPQIRGINHTVSRTSCDSTYKPCTTTEICGTPFYMSPEMHAGKQYSYDVDLWALGVMMYRMLTRRMPLGGDAKRNDISQHILRDEVQFRPGDVVSPQAKDLLKRMLARDPHLRPDLQSLKHDEFFANIDWQEVIACRNVPAWMPFLSSIPKAGKTTLDFRRGSSYDACDDPFPGFTFATPCFTSPKDWPSLKPDATPMNMPLPSPFTTRETSRLKRVVRRLFHCSRLAQPAVSPLVLHLPSERRESLSEESSSRS
ncbi:kinase-like domain-containing protein [Schizophyllum fasciatum]